DVKALEGKEVVFAFRPEAIKLSAPNAAKGEKAEGGYELSSNVDLTELLGDMTNVYANIGNVNVILKVNPHYTPEMGSTFKFFVPYSAAYVFDCETELAVESDLKRH
ncbi:MAG: TOBE domain-containing protein, partial [Clostridia bacterium]|nr:TOBE domain-containing protein [Clostridia bacterium]